MLKIDLINIKEIFSEQQIEVTHYMRVAKINID